MWNFIFIGMIQSWRVKHDIFCMVNVAGYQIRVLKWYKSKYSSLKDFTCITMCIDTEEKGTFIYDDLF